MKHNDTVEYRRFLKSLSADQIDKLQSNLLKEMRRRDSDHIKGDVVANSQSLRMLRATNKLP